MMQMTFWPKKLWFPAASMQVQGKYTSYDSQLSNHDFTLLIPKLN